MNHAAITHVLLQTDFCDPGNLHFCSCWSNCYARASFTTREDTSHCSRIPFCCTKAHFPWFKMTLANHITKHVEELEFLYFFIVFVASKFYLAEPKLFWWHKMTNCITKLASSIVSPNKGEEFAFFYLFTATMANFIALHCIWYWFKVFVVHCSLKMRTCNSFPSKVYQESKSIS